MMMWRLCHELDVIADFDDVGGTDSGFNTRKRNTGSCKSWSAGRDYKWSAVRP